MENQAVKKDGQDQEVIDAENPDLDPAEGDETPPGKEGEGEGDGTPGDGQGDIDGEVELVIEGDTQPKKNTPRGFLRRINKLNGKVETAKQETAGEREKRLFLEDENRVLKIALEQSKGGKPEELALPNPDDFDGGPSDPGYTQAFKAYQEKAIQAGVDAGVQKATQQTTVTRATEAQAQALEIKQTAHYERAAKLKVKDYEETEDKAIEIFGMDHTNHLIGNLDNSEVALYYFGKNPEVAQEFADMLKTQPIRALVKIGGLLSEIKIKPKSEPNPDPDIEIEGGTPSNLEAMQTKLNKLRDAARSGQGMRKVLDFKKQCKEKGIILR